MQKKAGATESVEWQHTDASNASYRVTMSNAGVDSSQSGEIDPLGRDAGARNTYIFPRQRTGVDYTYPGFADATSGNCTMSGIEAPCSLVLGVLNRQAGIIDPHGPVGPGGPSGIGPAVGVSRVRPVVREGRVEGRH